MSGPYQFSHDSARSPLDRQPPNLFPAGQPSAFKTNVNRAKTKKWVEAKPYSYDGDDWGEYDEYDEYGTEQAPPPQQPSGPTGLRQKGQTLADPGRSFTDPQRQAPPQHGRRNSFEAGDEHRAFSSTTPQPGGVGAYDNAPPHRQSPGPGGQPGYAPPHQPQHPYGPQGYGAPHQPSGLPPTGLRQASAAESDASDTPQHRRDFSPSAMPPPLQTRISPTPGSASGSPANAKFPTRKTSIGPTDSPSTSNSPVNPISPRDRAPSNSGKALPFIRPSDIYKRVEEERQKERASLDSSRPSLDSLSSRPRDEALSPRERESAELPRSPDVSRPSQPLETVAERKSEYLPEFNVGAQGPAAFGGSTAPVALRESQPPITSKPALPEVRRISAFGDDLWSEAQRESQNPLRTDPTISSQDDQGFRSAVDQAFTRNDDQRSIPPTPISKSDSSVSRSNTDSTSGISPIMSRVPSSATSALKARNLAGGDSSTPAIAEEASEGSTPVSRPVSTVMLGGPHQIPRKPSPNHSRNVSASSLPRTGVTPSPGESPARSPAVEPQKVLPEGETAQLGSLDATSTERMEGGLGGPSSAYASREADLVSAVRTNPVEAAPVLKAAQKESQDAFLESHQNAQSPVSDALPRSRSESPSKGRVQELAGKFGEVSHSRRGSTHSNASRHSIQSWERSQDNSRPSSPVKADIPRTGSPSKEVPSERPSTDREASFRPKLPGQWESYATTIPTPSDQSDRESQLAGEESNPQVARGPSPLDEVDLTPTTAKHPVSSAEPSKALSDPLAALKAAGTAMGEAFASVGLGSSSEAPEDRTPTKSREHGDVYLARPVQLDRTVSAASSIPPSPPAKDTPDSEDVPPPPPLKERSTDHTSLPGEQSTPVRPTMLPQLSSDPSEQDQESDRLRKEIVASLSPPKSSSVLDNDRSGSALQPVVSTAANRESSILPSEYDSYWADEQASAPTSNDQGTLSQPGVEQAPEPTKPAAPQLSEGARTTLLTRFSWEEPSSKVVPADEQAQSGAEAAVTTVAVDESTPAPAIDRGPSEEPLNQSFAGIPDPYFGPAHTMSTSKPDRLTDSDLKVKSPTPPPESEKPVASPISTEATRDVSHPAGLHVVNSAINPEAVDMPPRLSAEKAPVGPQTSETGNEGKTLQPQETPQVAAQVTGIEPTHGPSAAHEPAIRSPITDKPLSTKEIGALKSPSQRIATYNQTRNYWANNDHGLHEWVASAVAANPELVKQSIPEQGSLMPSSGTTRHKHTGSLSLFGKHHGSSGVQHPMTPYYEQYNSAAAQVPTTPTASAGPQAHPPGSGSGAGGRSASHQMQNKGKDILHTAGILGGKGVTGAKGLFAKGKSRFRASGSGDKVDK